MRSCQFSAFFLAGVIVLLGGCDSSPDRTVEAAAQGQATAYMCPSAATVGQAPGQPVPRPHKGKVGSLSFICSYTDAKGGASVLVAVTFGVTKAQLPQIVGVVADGRKPKAVSGIGDSAFVLAATAKDPVVLFAHSGDRAVNVTGDSDTGQAATIAVARVFL